MGKVILVCSGKGGVGKTTFAVNLSAVCARQGMRVLLLDLNMGRRNADIYLGMEDSILFDLGDVISGRCRLDRAIVSHSECEGLYLLSCPQYREIEGFGAGHVKALYTVLKEKYDLVIVDCPVSIGSRLRAIATGADAALILTIPDHSSIRSTEALCEKLESLGVPRQYYAINRMDKQYSGIEGIPSLSYITKTIRIPLVGIVSEEPAIHISNNAGYPVAMAQGTDMSIRFAEIASRLL